MSVLLAAALLATGCGAHEPGTVSVPSTTQQVQSAEAPETAEQNDPETEALQTSATEETAPQEPQTTEYTSAEIVCAGDNLIHSPIYNQAMSRSGDGGYDFSYAYENVSTLIEQADLAILNQETIITDKYPPSNYPRFCTPEALAEEMVRIGFDAVSISNNHCLDMGEEGLVSSLQFWKESYPDIPVYGAYLSEEDMNDIRTLEVNGITFAFLGYMEHTNGLSLPAGSECRLTYLSQEDVMEKQIKKAAEIADCVIVSVHFGVEVTNTVSEQQYYLAQKFADWGADIIIGTQPHTIQTMEYLEAADGRSAFVFYCLGNFISAMNDPYSMVEMLGRITVQKNLSTGEITLSGAEAVPLINHYDSGYRNVRIYPFSEYTAELAAAHGCAGTSYEFFQKVIDDNIPGEFLAEQ